ncbi:MAG: ArgE/DapE family deacylase [Armatimonadetes bacterium]|nr:ArgE/DapE family deacylase [Armatimonadota bacterium]
MRAEVSSHVERMADEAADLLCRLMAIPSVTGEEAEAQKYLAEHLKGLGFDTRLIPILEGIEDDEDHTPVPGHKGYDGRGNVIVIIPGTGGGRSILLNSHMDTVPCDEGMFAPRIEDGVIYGRGACDAKGQCVTIILALQALRAAGVRLKGDVIAEFVIEEEAGGNGALSAILDGYRADAALILEPTGLRIAPSNRGAVWFKLEVEGKATHMGRWREGVNAIDETTAILDIMREYEKELVAGSHGDPLFPDPGGTVKVNLGTIRGGEWPSMVAPNCTVEGGIGFLPNKRLAEVRDEVRAAIEAGASEWAKEHYSLTFNRLHNEAYRTDPDHPMVKMLHASAERVLGPTEVFGMTASCDARLFYHRGGMPTVVFGPSDICYAHAECEQIAVSEMVAAAQVVTDFMMEWCGVE